MFKKITQNNKGFSLVELSIVLAIISVILGITLSFLAEKSDGEKLAETRYKMQVIDNAVKAYLLKNQSIPCPADPTLNFTDSSFGAALRDSGTPYLCASTLASSGNMKLGMIPVRSLNLTDDFSYDAWGRRFMYFMIEQCNCSSTTAGCTIISFSSNDCGVTNNMTVQSTSAGTTIMSDSILMIISYGKNGHGAYPFAGGSSRLVSITGGASTDELENAHLTTTGVNTGFNRTFIARNQVFSDNTTVNFDDMVYFKNREQLINSINALKSTTNPICDYLNVTNFVSTLCGTRTTTNCSTVFNTMISSIPCYNF